MQAEETRVIHEGRNLKKIRELLGIKQEGLAMDLGLSQQAVSQLVQKETIDRELLERIAKVLKVTPETIRNFSEENAFNYINTFNDNSIGAFNNYNCSFNPLDKIVELYERLLQSEKEKIELLKGSKG